MRIRIIQSFKPDNSGKLNEVILNLDNYISNLNEININNDLNFEIKYDAIPFEPKQCNLKIKKKKKLKQTLTNDIIHILYPEVDPSLWKTYIVKDCIFSIPHKKIISILIDGRYYITDINRNCYLQLMTILKSLKRSKKIAYEHFKQNIDDFNGFDEDNLMLSPITPITVDSSTTLTPVSSSSNSLNSIPSTNQNINNTNLIDENNSKSLLSPPLNMKNLMAIKNDLSLYTTPPSTPPNYLGNYNEDEKLLIEIAKQIDFIYKEKNIFLSIFIQSLNNMKLDMRKRLVLIVSNIFNKLNIDFEYEFNTIFSNNLLKENDIKEENKKELGNESDIVTLNESQSTIFNNDIYHSEILNDKIKDTNIKNVNMFLDVLHSMDNKQNASNNIEVENENEIESDYKKSKYKKKKSKSNLKSKKNKKENENEENNVKRRRSKRLSNKEDNNNIEVKEVKNEISKKKNKEFGIKKENDEKVEKAKQEVIIIEEEEGKKRSKRLSAKKENDEEANKIKEEVEIVKEEKGRRKSKRLSAKKKK